MQNATQGAAPVTTGTADRKRFRPGRDFYAAVRGGLIAQHSNLQEWATANEHSRQKVEQACHGISNSEDARAIRAALAALVEVEIEES